MKTVLVYMMIGAMLGVVVASFVVPPVVAWYNEPGQISPNKPVETLCNVPDLIRYASKRLLWGQVIGAGVGALLFLFPGVFAVQRRRRQAEVPAPV